MVTTKLPPLPPHMADGPIYDHVPTGYLTIAQFAKRIGKTVVTVSKKIRIGKVDPKHLCLVRRGTKKPIIMIDYNAAVVPYLRLLPGGHQPKGFSNDAKEFRFLTIEEWHRIRKREMPKPGRPTNEERARRALIEKEKPRQEKDTEQEELNLKPNDLHSSNVVLKQLQIAKADIEVKVAKNKLIELNEAVALMRMIGTEIRQRWDAFEVRVIPLLAAENDHKKIRDILKEHRKGLLQKVKEMIEPEIG